MFKTTDAGAKRNNLNLIPAFTHTLVIDPVEPRNVYAGTTDGLFKSTDGGASWIHLGNPPQLNHPPLLIDPQSPQTLYAGSWTSHPFAIEVWKTTDGGASWSMLQTGDLHLSSGAWAINRAAPQTLLAPGYTGVPGSTRGLYKSTDGGATWSRLTLSHTANAVAFAPSNPSVIYAVEYPSDPPTRFRGVSRSTDGGATWSHLTGPEVCSDSSFIPTIAVSPGDPNTLYVGTETIDETLRSEGTSGCGVFRSTDGGNSWVGFDTGLIPPWLSSYFQINALVMDSTGMNLYAATNLGVFRYRFTATCAAQIYPTSQSFPSTGGSGSVTVTAPDTCSWSAVNDADWVILTSPAAGTGMGVLTFDLLPNPTGRPRTRILAIAGQSFTVTQAGNPGVDSDGDGIPDAIEITQDTNPDVKDNDIFANARLFVMQQYRDFLGREGDATGITHWTDRVKRGVTTRAQLIDTFFSSGEFAAVNPVARLYFAYFLRIPDYGGLTYWVNQYRAGASLEAISQAFAQSPEFQDRYGNLSNQQFVALVYQNVLGRAADPGGLAFWTGHLDSGAMTRGQVMLAFSESQENLATSFNKVFVVQIYVGMLRRSPEQVGFDFWDVQLNAGRSRLDLIAGFLASSEYRHRFLP